MKNANPYTGKWLREWFPEQTKSIPSILCWTVVFILDTVLVFWLASVLSIDILAMRPQFRKLMVILFLMVALVIFWLETVLYNRIVAAIRKSKTLD